MKITLEHYLKKHLPIEKVIFKEIEHFQTYYLYFHEKINVLEVKVPSDKKNHNKISILITFFNHDIERESQYKHFRKTTLELVKTWYKTH